MARSYRPVVRDQEFLLPPSMAEWLPPEHLVWFLIEVVDQLDTSRFHARSRRGGVGRRGYDPDMLLALLLYSYAVGERSSRRIERLCIDHVAFRVVCGQDGPDHSTLARFRADHQDAFADLFAQVLRLCAQAGMVKVGVVAIDGTKIAADAARGANRSREGLGREARRITDEILADAAQRDADEEAAAKSAGRDGGRDDDLPPGFATHSGRAANIADALAELDRQDAVHADIDAADATGVEDFLARVEAGDAVIGRPPAGTDLVRYHQARIVRFEQILDELAGIAGPAAATRRSDVKGRLKRARVALAAARADAATGNQDLRGSAARQRSRREQRARARGGIGAVVNVTDPGSRLMTHGSGGGSVQGYNAQVAVTDDHLVLGVHLSQDANDTNCYTPTLTEAAIHASNLDKDIGTVLADAGYFTDHNLTAPGPDRLIAPGKNRNRDTDDDQPAPGPNATAMDVMRHRLQDPANAEIYKRRSATVETVIAHLKDCGGLRTFSRRGLTANTAELNLAAAVHNLRRMHTTALAAP